MRGRKWVCVSKWERETDRLSLLLERVPYIFRVTPIGLLRAHIYWQRRRTHIVDPWKNVPTTSASFYAPSHQERRASLLLLLAREPARRGLCAIYILCESLCQCVSVCVKRERREIPYLWHGNLNINYLVCMSSQSKAASCRSMHLLHSVL